MFQTFPLESQIGPSMVDGKLIKTLKHETVPGVYTYEFNVTKGVLVVAASGGILKEIGYRLHSVLPWTRKKCVKAIMQAYAVDGGWRRVSEDRFGRMYRSQGGLYYAAIGKGAKFVDVGSMSFHESKFRIVS